MALFVSLSSLLKLTASFSVPSVKCFNSSLEMCLVVCVLLFMDLLSSWV